MSFTPQQAPRPGHPRTTLLRNTRQWHLWMGVILGAPMALAAVTAVFLAHKDSLSLDAIRVPVGWLPAYRGELAQAERREIRTVLALPDGSHLVGTKRGLFLLEGSPRGGNQPVLIPVEPLAQADIKNLSVGHGPWLALAAGKEGLWGWRAADRQWVALLPGDAHSGIVWPDGTLGAATPKKGFLLSVDGGSAWEPAQDLAGALDGLPPPLPESSIPLGKFLTDLHTGKALMGKAHQWIWIDVLGLALLFLAGSGVFLWWKFRQRKEERRRGERLPRRVPSAFP